MKYIRLFETETGYDSEAPEFEYPTVSLVQDVEDVRYMTLRDKYTREYLTFEALEAGTFTLNIPANVNSTYMISVSYSTDNGNTWNTTTVDNTAQTITTPTINAGDKVLWKGVGEEMARNTSNSYFSYFSSTGNFNVSGNIMSLLYGDEFANQLTFPPSRSIYNPSVSIYNFTKLFINANKLISASNMVLPATTLTYNCYAQMFQDCISLTIAPVLTATTLEQDCYKGMFSGCTALTTAPELPATTLASSCYYSMFQSCTSLTTAPELPATTLANSCYHDMFSGCTALTTAPELPATTLANSCYHDMFNGCTALTTAPVLPATTLAAYCYIFMFLNCTSLTTVPELSATTLTNQCYESMFRGCSRLNYIKAMFTTTPSNSYTKNWVSGVAATGTFVKNSAAEWDVTGVNGIPTGWTVETASA